MTWYPRNNAGYVRSDQIGTPGVSGALIAHLTWTGTEAATADTDGVMAALTDDGSEAVVTTGLTDPPCPRNITATAGGTAGDIKAIQVVVEGTNINDEAITETLPAFTVNTAGTVQGSYAFKTVTQVTIPAHDGTAATTAIGFGDKLGLPFVHPTNTVLAAALGGTREGVAPTVVSSTNGIEWNTVDIFTSLNGSAVDVWLIAEGGN